MTHQTIADAQKIAIVDDFFDAVFHLLESWRPEIEAMLTERLASAPEGAGQITGAQLSDLVEEEAKRLLALGALPLYGAGFCASDALILSGSPLAWWQGADRAPLVASTFGIGQGAIDLRRLEWYRVPEATGKRHVAGPFVDYLCSNEITMTSAVPIEIDGRFAGVLCADVIVATLESELLPRLGAGVTLLNSAGRVIVSADPELETGDLFDRSSLPGRAVTAEGSPFVLIEPTAPEAAGTDLAGSSVKN
jgi:hypothetical protein